MKGIKLEGCEQERNTQINNYIGELGGKKIRRKRGVFSGRSTLKFNAKRCGECYSTTAKKPGSWCEQVCFGVRSIFKTWPWGGSYDDLAKVTMKAKGQYDTVCHYTLTDCTEECFKKAIVVCVREMAISQDQYMTCHVAGECPYCNYHENY